MTAKTPRRGKPTDAPPNPFQDLLNPPPHVSRRCGARARSNGGQPCRKWAMVGKSRCRNHGGASTGRPPTTGQHTAAALRSRHMITVAKGILALYYEKPDPIEAPPGVVDEEAITQAYLEAQRAGRAALAAEAAWAAAAHGGPGAPGAPGAPVAPASAGQLERIADGARAARATDAPEAIEPGPAIKPEHTTRGGRDQP